MRDPMHLTHNAHTASSGVSSASWPSLTFPSHYPCLLLCPGGGCLMLLGRPPCYHHCPCLPGCQHDSLPIGSDSDWGTAAL